MNGVGNIWFGAVSLARATTSRQRALYNTLPYEALTTTFRFGVYICCRCKRYRSVRQLRGKLWQSNWMVCSKTWVVFLDGRFRSIGWTIFFRDCGIWKQSRCTSIDCHNTVEQFVYTIDRLSKRASILETRVKPNSNIGSVDILSDCWSVSSEIKSNLVWWSEVFKWQYNSSITYRMQCTRIFHNQTIMCVIGLKAILSDE